MAPQTPLPGLLCPAGPLALQEPKHRYSPLRAAGQVVCLRGTGWALELAGRSQLGGPGAGPPAWQQLGPEGWPLSHSLSESAAHT